jgi:hypothetical protein
MCNGSQLPSWVSYLQAFTVPIIALVGVWIAARQMAIADDKLRLDTFERQYQRRFATYEETRKILGAVFKNISEDDIREYGLVMLSAEFLFDDELWRYLKDIHQRVAAFNSANSNVSSSDERAEFKRIREENLNWIMQQGDWAGGFSSRFRPFLAFTPIKRSWWLRWP